MTDEEGGFSLEETTRREAPLRYTVMGPLSRDFDIELLVI